LRLIFWSNAPFCQSGYGNQTALFVPRLNKLGHEVAIHAFVGLRHAVMQWNGIQVYPQVFDRWGNDAVAAHAEHWKAQAVISLMDALMCNPSAFVGVPWLPWFPVDGSAVRGAEIPRLKRALQPLVFSRFGEQKARKAGLDVRYIPHGTDLDTFCPGDQRTAREAVGLPQDRFIVGMVAANQGRPPRKAFPEQLRAFSQFHERHPDALLYLHTFLGPQMEGIDLRRLLAEFGLREHRDWLAVPDYNYTTGLISQQDMALLYRSFDCLMNVSWGEGFGLPILEAQACGTPVLTGDWSAMPEITFGGYKVAQADTEPVWNKFDVWQWSAHPAAVAEGLEWLYKADRAALGAQGRQGSLAYDADLVTETYWRPVLEEVERTVAGEGKLELVRF
jgi:glycosyltransferase involved in cell wall biosynthesis